MKISKIKSVAKSVVRRVRRAARAVGRRVKAAARAVRDVVVRSWSKISIAWRKSLKPVLKNWARWMAATMWIASLLVAPAPTIVATVAAGLSALGLAAALERLQRDDGRLARLGVRLVKAFIQSVRLAFYAVAGLLVVLSASMSLSVAILLVVQLAVSVFAQHATVEVVTSPAEDLEIPTVVRRKLVPAGSPVIQSPDLRNSTMMSACDACGTVEGDMRVRGAHIPFPTCSPMDRFYVEEGELGAPPMLCVDCHALECEDLAVALTGISLKKRQVEVRLNERGLAALPQCARSKGDVSVLYWTIEPTAWWRDRQGDNHPRRWSCFFDGKVVANVTLAHRSRNYVVTVRGRVVSTQRTFLAAKLYASDVLMDSANTTATLVEGVGGMADVAPAPAKLLQLHQRG